MTTLLPLLAITLAALAFIFSPPGERRWPSAIAIAGLVLAAAVAIPGWVYREQHPWVWASAAAFAVGLAGGVIADFAQRSGRTNATIPLGLAAAFAGGAHWTSPDFVFPAQLGLIVGAAAGVWCSIGAGDGWGLGAQFALGLAAMCACDAIGAKAMPVETGSMTGVALGFAATVIALLLGLPDLMRRRQPGALIQALLATALLCAAGWLIGARYLSIREAWLIFGGTSIAALIVHLLVPPDRQEDAVRFLLAAIIWIAIGTIAFALRKGFGMTIALMGASTTLLLLRNPRALLTTGPLVALVFYRVIREAFPEVSRALDIGQHYAFVGIAIGTIVPLLPTEWLTGRDAPAARQLAAKVLWMLALVALPVPIALVLSTKGLVGYVAGLGFAALVEGLKGSKSLMPLVFVGGLASATTLVYAWSGSLLDLTRDQKQALLPWVVGVTLVVAILIALLSTRKETVSE